MVFLLGQKIDIYIYIYFFFFFGLVETGFHYRQTPQVIFFVIQVKNVSGDAFVRRAEIFVMRAENARTGPKFPVFI